MINSRTKQVFFSLGALAIVLALALFGFYTLIQNKINDVSTYQSELQTKFQNQEKDRALRDVVKNSGSDIDHLISRIVATDGAVSFIEMIESLARERNLTINVDSVNTTPTASHSDAFELLTLNLEVEGGWANNQHFLAELETLPYNVSLKAVSFSTAGGDPSTKRSNPVWNGAITISTLKKK